MSTDFEKHLSQQQIRHLPPDWKREILATAAQARQQEARVCGKAAPSAGTRLRAWVHDLLWPSPVAWGGVAGIWIVLLAVGKAPEPDFASHASAAALSPQDIQLVRQQNQWVREQLAFDDAQRESRRVPDVDVRPRSGAPELHPQRRGDGSRPDNTNSCAIV
jgi:hypothetical protein